jgi:two-component system OmpR family sensor kinase
MLTKTFRMRLTLIYTVVVVLMFSVANFIIRVEFKDTHYKNIDKELLREASEFSRELGPAALKNNEEIIRKVGDEYYQVVNLRGEVHISSLNSNYHLWPVKKELLPAVFKGTHRFDTVTYKGANHRVLYYPMSESSIISIGGSLKDVEEDFAILSRLFLIFFPFVVVISSVMSWFLAGRALSPVVQIKSLAEQIRHGRLEQRIDIGVKGKEIDDLVRMFNDMLESIQHSMEAQKRFTSDVSHEIRSPLTSLRGSMEVALRKKRSPEEYEEMLRSNLSDVIRLSRITDDLLFLAKADNNIVELRKHWFDVNQLLKGIVERMRYDGLSIVEKYEENLEFYGDSNILEQAFSNLVQNAIKYTPVGGTVTIATRKEDDSIKIVVSDTGVGIPEGEIPHIFDRFYRVDKERSRKMGGTGLGLAITRWIVSAHNGKIIVKSTVGSGSDFIVFFPKTSP